jgi:hypothetical protein
MKLLRRTILVVVLLLIIAGAIVYFRLDGIVKRTVESEATHSLNLNTTLNSAHLSLFGGKVNLNELKIASPPGYSAPQMLDVGDTNVAVSYGQLRQDPVHVQSLTINKPKLVIEQQNGVFNFKKAMDQIPPGESSSKSQPMKLIIDELTVQDAQVVIRPGLPGIPDEITVPVPSIIMKKVGTGDGSQNGAAMKDVVMQVITALAGSASNSSALPSQLKAMLNVNVGQVVGKLGAEAQKQIAAAIPGDLGKALSEVVKDPQALIKDPGKALQGLGGLVGGNNAASGSATTQPGDIKDQAIHGLEGLLGGKKKK